MIQKIISGGQTGADRAGLDAAMDLGIDHGGWFPKGRRTEDGRLPAKYRLGEMQTASYPKRTQQNIKDSDGTVIFSYGKLSGGSSLTRKYASAYDRPCLVIDLYKFDPERASLSLMMWLNHFKIKTLNVAGQRLSKAPAIYDEVKSILKGA